MCVSRRRERRGEGGGRRGEGGGEGEGEVGKKRGARFFPPVAGTEIGTEKLKIEKPKKTKKRTLSRNVVRVSMAYSDSLEPAFGGALVVAGAAAATTEGEALPEELRAGDGDEAAAALERA